MEAETAQSAPADPTCQAQEAEIPAGGQRSDAATPARTGAGAASEAPAPPGADRYVNAELDALALKLDAHSRTLRSDMLAHLADCHRRAEERQREAVAALASGAARELAAKEQELARTAAELEHQREILRRTGGALFKAARWRRQHTLGCMAWRAWREQAARQCRIRANMAVAVKHYDEGRLWRGVFRAWRAEATSQLRLRIKAQAAAALQQERARIWEEANASGAQQARRLAEMEAALAVALEERARLEENMKRAFMRGVCALNLEAMALMKGGGAPQGGQAAPAEPADQQPQAAVQGATATAGCASAAGQAAVGGAAVLAGAAEQLAQEQQLREQLLDKLLLQGGAGGSGAGWAIGAMGLRIPAPLAPATSFAPGAPAAGAIGGDGGTERAYSMPAPEQPRPLISLAPTRPVPPVPQLPPNVSRAAERHSVTGARPGTAVPCSLPSNVPPHMAGAAGARRTAASPARPATAPPRRQQGAASTAHQQHGQQQQQKHGLQQQQQQVSRRSLAGQAREGAGLANKTGQPLVVRGAAGATAGQRS